MKVRLTKLGTVPEQTVDGEATYPPREGHPFVLVDSIIKRILVHTSNVVEVRGNGEFTTTAGMVYHVELLEPLTKPVLH